MLLPLLRCFALLALLLSLIPPASAAERKAILLYGFSASALATPPPVPNLIALLVQDELQKNKGYAVVIRTADDPLFRRAEAEQPSADPTRLHQALRVAHSLGAHYVVQGAITAYEPPQARDPGKVTIRLTAASTATEVSREVFVTAELKVTGKSGAPAARVLAPTARAVATAILSEAIPALEQASPADREQAAARARARAQEAAVSGATPQAVADLRRAARLTPEDAATHVALGEALIKQGLVATALLEFRHALALEEGVQASLPPAGGIEGGRSGVSNSGGGAPGGLRLRIVRALSERGLWDEAIAEARRGLEREPDAEALRLAWAEAAIRSGDGPGALTALRPLHASRPPREAEWDLLAAAHALAGETPRWLDALVRGAVAGVPESEQYGAVARRLDQAFRALTDEWEEAERRVLGGQLSPPALGEAAARGLAQARAVSAYLGRLAFPEGGAAAHEARQQAWDGLVRAGDRTLIFAAGGTFDDLAAARVERLRAIARLNPGRTR